MYFETIKDNLTGRIVEARLSSRSFTDEQILVALNRFLVDDAGCVTITTEDETLTWIGNNTAESEVD